MYNLKTVCTLKAQNKYSVRNRDKSKYYSSKFDLKRFPSHLLPIAHPQLKAETDSATLIFTYAYVDRIYALTGYLVHSMYWYKMTSFLKIVMAFFKENLLYQCKLFITTDNFLVSVFRS